MPKSTPVNASELKVNSSQLKVNTQALHPILRPYTQASSRLLGSRATDTIEAALLLKRLPLLSRLRRSHHRHTLRYGPLARGGGGGGLLTALHEAAKLP